MSRLRVWCAGASVGYLVGWLAGSNVQRMAEGRRLGRPEPRTALPAPVESPEPRIGRENGAQRCGLLDPIGLSRCTRPQGHEGMHHSPEARGVPWPDLIPFQRDDEPCTTRSPGGGLPCCRKGTHTAHVFEGAHARDRKDDTDEGIE